MTQLVEQPPVLDGDDGLAGEVPDQLNVPVGEAAHLLAENDNDADQLILLEHGDREHGAIAAELGTGDRDRITLEIELLIRNIGTLVDLPGPCGATEWNIGTGTQDAPAAEFG